MRISNLFRTVVLSAYVPLVNLAPAIAAAGVPEPVSALVAETKRSIKTVDMEEFKTIVDKKSYEMIIDVREPAEYASGHIPDAISIPRGVIEFKIWKYIGYPDNTDTGKKIYLYCKSGSRCALATRSLQDLGFSDVTAVDMKINAWRDAGYPLVQ